MKKLLLLSLLGILGISAYAKQPLTEGETDPVMLDLDPYMIEALFKKSRFGREGGMADLIKEKEFMKLVDEHDIKLFNGPMIGAVTPNSVRIWIRTAGTAEFKVVIGDRTSETVKTSADTDFTGIAVIDGLKAFTEYNYSIVLDGKKISDPSFKFKTFPAKGAKERYSIAFGSGSCYVPEKEGIWRTMAGTGPLAYLALGDNVYIDRPNRRDSQRLHYYRRMLRKEYREMISQTAIYSVWDDHDMGKDDSAGGPGLDKSWKLPTLEVFKQNWNNPHYGNEAAPATWHSFTMGDVEFFMLDGRFYRTDMKDKKDTTNTMLGGVQKQWLLDELKKSTATFKVLCSGTMWHDLADKGGKDSWAGKRFRAERDEIFDLITKNKIDGVLLLAGDRHRTEIWKTNRPGYPLYEFLSAKVTNIHSHRTRKEAEWSHSEGNFWGELEFNFKNDDPGVTFKAINQNGEQIHSFFIS